jgi:prepilin-type N-terminal cleavage/methylation domain-containing protein
VSWKGGQAGFTVLETLFVVVILAILLGLAFPAYQRVVMERRVQNTTREIAADVRVAQQAAVAKSAEARSAWAWRSRGEGWGCTWCPRRPRSIAPVPAPRVCGPTGSF